MPTQKRLQATIPTSPLRLMLWLKWTLIWRGYRRSKAKIWGTIVSLLVFTPLSLGAAWVVSFLAHEFPGIAPDIARDALAIIYLLWIVTPLLGFNLNDSYDLTKLFVYPLTYQQIFVGSVVGSLLDLPVLLTLPTFVVLLWLFSPTLLALLLNFVLLTLFLGHTLAMGQTITLTLIGFLRSRRFRDITIVLFPLIGMAYYIGQRTFFTQLDPEHLDRTLEATPWKVADWLPPGFVALGLHQALSGNSAAILPFLLIVGCFGFLTLWLAANVLQRLYLGDAGPRREGISFQPPLLTQERERVSFSWLPTPIAAVIRKEWIYFQREPQFKAMAVQIVYMLVAITVPILLPLSTSGTFSASSFWHSGWALFGLSGTLLLSTLPLLFNIWGGEGAAITLLFSMPIPRRTLLLGKNIAHGTLLLGLNLIVLVAVAALTHTWARLPLTLAWVVIATPVLVAAGNLVSIRFPHRMLVRGQRWQRGGLASAGGGDGSGCLYALLYLLAYLAAFAALLPAIAAVLAPLIFGFSPFWYALTLPLAFGYAAVLYIILLGQAEVWLMAREPEIMAKIVPSE